MILRKFVPFLLWYFSKLLTTLSSHLQPIKHSQTVTLIKELTQNIDLQQPADCPIETFRWTWSKEVVSNITNSFETCGRNFQYEILSTTSGIRFHFKIIKFDHMIYSGVYINVDMARTFLWNCWIGWYNANFPIGRDINQFSHTQILCRFSWDILSFKSYISYIILVISYIRYYLIHKNWILLVKA